MQNRSNSDRRMNYVVESPSLDRCSSQDKSLDEQMQHVHKYIEKFSSKFLEYQDLNKQRHVKIKA